MNTNIVLDLLTRQTLFLKNVLTLTNLKGRSAIRSVPIVRVSTTYSVEQFSLQTDYFFEQRSIGDLGHLQSTFQLFNFVERLIQGIVEPSN